MIKLKRIGGIIAGPALFATIILFSPAELDLSQTFVLDIALWMMVIWWITEAIPLYATSLIPLNIISIY